MYREDMIAEGQELAACSDDELILEMDEERLRMKSWMISLMRSIVILLWISQGNYGTANVVYWNDIVVNELDYGYEILVYHPRK
jgi:hypothetical protein